jgi:hypothetical protein
MKVLYSPQRNDKARLTYSFGVDIIDATYEVLDWVTVTDTEGNQTQEMQVIETHTDTFDFSAMPDGEAGEITTTLPVNPITKAKKVNGELEAELLNFIGPEATEEERFPAWKVV